MDRQGATEESSTLERRCLVPVTVKEQTGNPLRHESGTGGLTRTAVSGAKIGGETGERVDRPEAATLGARLIGCRPEALYVGDVRRKDINDGEALTEELLVGDTTIGEDHVREGAFVLILGIDVDLERDVTPERKESGQCFTGVVPEGSLLQFGCVDE